MIRTFSTADVARVSHLQPDGWDNIETFFRFYTESPFCHAIKIEDGHHITAVGSLIKFESTAWFAHIIVESRHRRGGLGSMITRELIRCAEKNGCDRQLLIATAMGSPLYEQFGFRRSCDYHYYHEHTPEDVVQDPNIRPLGPEDVSSVLALDLRATGEVRAGVLLPHIKQGHVYPGADPKTIDGFYLPTLGEGLIVAESSRAGSALMKFRLATTKPAPVMPAGNQHANRLLVDWGFKLRDSASRMVRNGEDPLDPQRIFNRIGGHVG